MKILKELLVNSESIQRQSLSGLVVFSRWSRNNYRNNPFHCIRMQRADETDGEHANFGYRDRLAVTDGYSCSLVSELCFPGRAPGTVLVILSKRNR